MFRTSAPLILFGLVFLLAASDQVEKPSGPNIEKWADSRLKITSGLTLWLDASRQGSAGTAHQKQLLQDGSLVDVWYDGSGNGNHVVQQVHSAQPRYLPAGELAVVRFDGVDDCLGLTG